MINFIKFIRLQSAQILLNLHFMNSRILSAVFLCAMVGVLKAQSFEVPPTNSHSKISQRVAATDIEVEYNRPNRRGRTIFGGLVPYGQVWRTGSDASTKLYFSTPVFLNNQPLDSGTYELFTIPGGQEWSVILQKNQSQWGSYAYNAENDVLSLVVTPQRIEPLVETFTIGFDNVTSNSAQLSIEWEHTKVPIQISVDLEVTVLPKLEASLKKEGRKPYFRAAMFYFENGLDINRAAELMALAIAENPNHLGMLYRQGLILEKKGDVNGAITASEKSLQLALSAGKELKEEYTKLNKELLRRLRK